MIELTREQHQAMANDERQPIRFIDPVTTAEYVLVRAETYDRFQSLLSEDQEWVRACYPSAMALFARDGWDDPRMDVYDALDPRRQK